MFNIGDKVVYPMHGAGIIEAVEEKEILGKKRKYYIMRMPIGNMKVMIPLKNVEDAGLRDVISTDEVDQVLAVLSDDISRMPKNWNRRYRANMDKIRSGDIYEVAMVVRNLMLRDKEKGLSTGERKMLANAKQILISEFVLAKDLEEKTAEELIDKAIL
ncbi:MAG: CarD family transcriptional regulator [Anaeromicrobium sp.]|jgi:CarD family transcriptional regulator|uniref:CarD family transcriptional regulator n=1 Tax=Anaeromicrobium sp. TaxID=1929132 RepID=UPI0025EA4A0B|nr:CarD family transcriptional regulator [Anaeromicrobium sp.]MCT4593906.1 CarD family transcriptional regulator [Anaeromicrobium sp.]